MTEAAEKLVRVCQELVGYLEELEGAAEIQREIASTAMELKDQMNAADIILDRAPETRRRKAGSAADQRGRSDERDVVRAHALDGVRVRHVGGGR